MNAKCCHAIVAIAYETSCLEEKKVLDFLSQMISFHFLQLHNKKCCMKSLKLQCQYLCTKVNLCKFQM